MAIDLTPLWISLKTALAATLLAFLLGLAAARWMMTYRGKARGLIDGVLTLPLVLPPTVVGFLLLLLLGKNGPVGQLLEQIGISVIFTWAAAVIAATVVAFPLMYKTVLGAFEQVDLTLISSARTLGASEWRIFWQILLPLAGPGVLAGTILAFARALGEFGATLMVGGSIIGVTRTIPIAIYFAADAGRMGVALAWVLLMVAVSLVVITGIHVSSSSRAQIKGKPPGLIRRWFNGLYFGQFSDRMFNLTPWSQSQPHWSSPTVTHPLAGNHLVTTAISTENIPTLSNTVPHTAPSPIPTPRTTLRVGDAQPNTFHPIAPNAPGDAAHWHTLPERQASPPSTSLETQLPTATAPSTPLPVPIHPSTHPSPPLPELKVRIEKQLPEFRLQVKFRTLHEPLGLLGASGSGKTMTLRCIAGLETPSKGRIVLNKRVLFDSETGVNVPSRDRKVGLVFQNYALFPHLTVAQNIAFGMKAIPKPQRAAHVVQYLDRIGLPGMGDRYPHQLSGGQQQRVALARALAIQPDILLLDEPLSALDTYLRSQIEQLLIDVLAHYAGVTLFITHKLEEAYRVCADLLVLSDGQIVAKGTKEEIFTRPPTFQVAKVTECKNFSRASPLDLQHVEALDWGCSLEVIDPIPADLTYLGIRAHHIRFPRKADQSNTFPGWIAMISETQHRVSLYIKLHSSPSSPQDYHLQAEVYREKWDLLRSRPFPWNIRLDPVHLIMMPD